MLLEIQRLIYYFEHFVDQGWITKQDSYNIVKYMIEKTKYMKYI